MGKKEYQEYLKSHAYKVNPDGSFIIWGYHAMSEEEFERSVAIPYPY